MARGKTAIAMAMSANPYPKPKTYVPRLTLCEVCDRELPTKDWPAHKNSKKHREAEAKERGETVKNAFGFGGDAIGFGSSNESANANEFGFGDAFANTATTDGNGWATGVDSSTTKSTSYDKNGKNGNNGNNGGSGGSGDQRACFGCGETGHQRRDCPQASNNQGCFNCGDTGHRKADCPQPRKPMVGASGVCFNCNQPGHNKSECTEPRASGGGGGGGGGGRACHNCGEEGHISRDCEKPRVIKCRNCDEEGHAARECPKPRDWSRVKCRNCDEYGHGEKRCPKPAAETTGGDWGDASAPPQVTADGWGDTVTETTGNWADDTTAAEDNIWGQQDAPAPAPVTEW